MAATDLDQAAVMWLEIVKKKEKVLAGEKGGEKDKPDNQETLSRLRLAMTQRLAQREQIELIDGIDPPLSETANMIELGREEGGQGEIEDTEVEEEEDEIREVREREIEREGGRRKREWKERPGAGMPAGKRQRLAQDQDENLIQALERQDEKAGKLYKETLTAEIDKLVEAIAQASQPGQAAVPAQASKDGGNAEQKREERLAEQERKLNELMEAQKMVQKKLDDSVQERVEAEKRSEERQERMMELLQLLMNK